MQPTLTNWMLTNKEAKLQVPAASFSDALNHSVRCHMVKGWGTQQGCKGPGKK